MLLKSYVKIIYVGESRKIGLPIFLFDCIYFIGMQVN